MKHHKREIFMGVAVTIAQLGTCDRKQVGCVIIQAGRCITWGYNGAPPGLPHCDENDHGWADKISTNYFVGGGPAPKETRSQTLAKEMGCRNATHAEANALAFAARQGISTDNSILFTTCSPCENCSRLLIAAGVREVYYREEYRDRTGVELLERAGIVVGQL